MTTGSHLSFYALDRVRLGEPTSAEERQHLGTCSSCAAYVGAAVAEAAGVATTLPAWLASVRLAAPAAPPKRWRAFWPVWAMGPVLVLAAGTFLVWPRAVPEDSTAGIREKGGGPAVQIFVRRGERVFPWGGRAIRPGDRLRVEVNGGGFGFVSIAGRSPSETKPVLLYDGALTAGAQLLPLSFRVDAKGGQEILSVIFGRHPVPSDLHARAKEAAPEDASTWRQILVLDKEIP